jgi:hypothetical protein
MIVQLVRQFLTRKRIGSNASILNHRLEVAFTVVKDTNHRRGALPPLQAHGLASGLLELSRASANDETAVLRIKENMAFTESRLQDPEFFSVPAMR